MSNQIFLTPGPSALYPTFEKHLRTALDAQIPSISHRGQKFQAIYRETFEALKELFELPDNYAVLFCSSANEIWERLLMNCVESHSFHLVNGAFSKKFYQFSQQLYLHSGQQTALFGEGFVLEDIQIPKGTELLALTHNETSSGVIMPEATIHQLATQNPDCLTAVDMVSSAPYPQLDFSKIDSAYFSVQKAFGMPAGLGVWLVNEACLAKAQKIEKEAKNRSTGTYHRLIDLWETFEKFETPETPNVLSIYLLGKIAQDMLQKGIKTLREETDLKAKMLYDFAEKTEGLEIFVQNPEYRSPTVIVINTATYSSEIIKKIATKGYVLGSGYKDYKNKQLRVANFPAISVEKMEDFIKVLDQSL
jgi:phosphoserine aminotransferase